jgi:hypothetical protein
VVAIHERLGDDDAGRRGRLGDGLHILYGRREGFFAQDVLARPRGTDGP